MVIAFSKVAALLTVRVPAIGEPIVMLVVEPAAPELPMYMVNVLALAVTPVPMLIVFESVELPTVIAPV